MLNENQKALDRLCNKENLLSALNKVLFILFIIGLTYISYFSNFTTSDFISKTEDSGKFKAAASKRSGGHFCTIELKNGQLITLACPHKVYYSGQEIKLDKITTWKVTYYEVQDKLTQVFNRNQHPKVTSQDTP